MFCWEYRFVRTANHCILFLFTFYKPIQWLRSYGCITLIIKLLLTMHKRKHLYRDAQSLGQILHSNLRLTVEVKSKVRSYNAVQGPVPSKRGSIQGCSAWSESRLWSMAAEQWWGSEECAYNHFWNVSVAAHWGLTFSFDGEVAHWGAAGEHLSRRAQETRRPWIWLGPARACTRSQTPTALQNAQHTQTLLDWKILGWVCQVLCSHVSPTDQVSCTGLDLLENMHKQPLCQG